MDGQAHSLAAGEYFEIDIFDPTVVHSDKPIQVAQFSTGSDYTTAGLPKTEGDPFMIVLPSLQQFQKEYTVSTRIDRNDVSFLSLVVPNLVVGDVFLDGVPIDTSEFTPVPGTDYSVAALDVEDGSYHLNSPLPFGATIYGYSYDESYGYVAGQSFVPLDVSPNINLNPEYTRLHTGNQHEFIATLTDQDGNLLNGIRVDYTIDGPHQGFGSVRTNALGVASIIVDGQISGLDTIVATAIGVNDTAQVDWFSATPAIEIVSPGFGYSTDAGRTVLISGHAESGNENATIVSLTIDGQRIDTVDASGNFFTTIDLPLGKSSYEFEVINSLGVSATTTHGLEGLFGEDVGPSFDSLIDVSSVVDLYAVTSFDERTDHLYAELSIVNNGQFAIGSPLWIGVRNVSDPSVEVLDFDGLWNDGTPYYDLSSLLSGDQLLPGASTLFDAIAFDVPNRSPFDYDLVLLGSKNQAPLFTSTPVVAARGGVGESYTSSVATRDPDGDDLTIELVSSPQGMSLVDLGDGSGELTWDNVPADLANYPVSLRVSDSRGGSAIQSYVISIIDGTINRPPVFISHPVTDAYADQPYQYDSSARDADGDTLTYSLSVLRVGDATSTQLAGLIGSGSVFTIDPESGEITWQPSGPDTGDYTVVVTADDARGGIDDQHYTLRLNPVEGNYPPVFTSSPTTSVTAGASYLYQATAVDPDEDELSFSLQNGPLGANMTSTGLLTFDTPAGIDADYPFVVEVTDGMGHTTIQAFTLATSDATPATLAGRVYQDVDDTLTFDAAIDTPLADVIVYRDANGNLRFDVGETSTLTGADGLYAINSPVGDYRVGFVRADQWATIAPTSLVYQGAAAAAENVANLDFVVKERPAVNNDPQITTTPPLVGRYFETFIYDVDATDPDGDALTYQLLDAPQGVTLDPVTGILRWLPEPQIFDTGTIVIRVIDGRGGSDRQAFFPTFTLANGTPEITSTPPAAIAVDVLYQYPVRATDPDGDVLLYSVDPGSQSRGVTIDSDTGQLSWTPTDTTPIDITVDVDDGRGSRASQTFTLEPVIDAFPVLDVTPFVRIPIGTEIEVPIDASDPLGDVVTVGLLPAAIAAGAQIVDRDLDGDTIDEKVLIFTPPIVGSFSLPIVAFDPAGHSVTATVTVEAYDPLTTPDNSPPTDLDVPTPILYLDQPVQITPTVDDPDGDPILWSIDVIRVPIGDPTGDPIDEPQIDPDTGVISWTPTTPGNTTVKVTADDTHGGVVCTTVTFTVLDNAPPRFVSTPIRGGAVGVNYSYDGDAVDPNVGETAQLVYHANILPASTSFGDDFRDWPTVDFSVDPATGVLDWTPTEAGDYLVTLIAIDPHDEVGSQSFFVNIINDTGENSPPDLLTNPAPRFLLSPAADPIDSATTNAGVPLDYHAIAIDADNDALTYSLVSGPTGLSVTPDGHVRFAPHDTDVGNSGTYTLQVVDGRGGQDTETFNYAVTTDATADNLPPVITSTPATRTPLSRPYIYNANATDPDGDSVHFELAQAPDGASIDAVTGLISWTPSIADLGSHPIIVTAVDIIGAASSQIYTLEVVRGDAAPRITSTPPVTSRAGDHYYYGVGAVDDDGDPLEYYLGSATAADFPLAIDSATGILSGTTPFVASYDVEIVVVDPTGRFDTQLYQLRVHPLPVIPDPADPPPTTIDNNHAPVITSTATYVGFAGSDYVYDFTAQDVDLPSGDVLTWALTGQPSATVHPVSFDSVTQTLLWQPDASEVNGLFNFEIKVTDLAGASSTQTWSVLVRPANIAPVLSPIADQTLAAGGTLAMDVYASDANLDPIEYSVDSASTDRGVSIDGLGRLRWTTTADDLDNSPMDVTVTASDGNLSDSLTFAVTITADDAAPTVLLSASRVSLDVGDFVDFSVRSSDNVNVVSETLTLVSVTDFQGNTTPLDEPISLSVTRDARLTTLASHLGSITLVATATDAAGNTATSNPVTVLVFDPNDTERPQVTLLNPTTGDEILTPTDILGSVTDDDSTGLIWNLTIAPADGSAPSRTVASGLGEFTADVIGLLDPTLLRNGSYAVTLSATDSGNNTGSDTEIVEIDTELKLGNFSLSFTDLSIPVAGLPITIIRSYDSLDANIPGEFGYGWSLNVNLPELSLVQASTGPPSLKGYPTFIDGTRMTVTTPDGEDEGFTFKWVQKADGLGGIGLSTTYRPSFVPDPGNQYSLTPPGVDDRFRKLTNNGPYQDDSGRQYSGQDPYYGGVYQLKQSDTRGKQIDYDILIGRRGTTQMTAHRMKDKYGNSLEIRDDGIFSNRGRSVTFTRDARGRITSITDPTGAKLLYRYDAQGRLTEFHDRRASERLFDEIDGNEFEPTRFEYNIRESIERNELASGTNITDAELDVVISQIPGADNFLSKIIDPLGVDALRADFGRDGRLGGLLDAQGNPSRLEYDLTDPDNLTVSNATTALAAASSSFDSKNRLIRETSATGQVTIYTYLNDSLRYPYQTIQVVGDSDGSDAWYTRSGDDRVTTRNYHSDFDGAVTSETDPDGNVTVTAYNTWGLARGYPSQVFGPNGEVTDYQWAEFYGIEQLQLHYTTDQDGNRTTYRYDVLGNVNYIAQSNTFTGTSTSTSFTYSTFGDLLEVIDQDGNIRKISYDQNGRQVGTEFAHYTGDDRPPTQQEYGNAVADFQQHGTPLPVAPPTRTLITTENTINRAGDLLFTRTIVAYQEWDVSSDTFGEPLFEPWQDEGYITVSTEIRNESGGVEFDALGRAFRTTNENGRISEMIYDARGLAIETRSESPDETGSGVWLISRTVYDTEGRSVYSTGIFPEGTAPSQITGTHTVYEDGTGRVLETEQLLGITIDIIASSSSLGTQDSSVASAGSVISSSRSFYDDNDRVVETENNYGLKSQTLYDVNGRVIESRSQTAPASGASEGDWLVRRTIYDTDGKVITSTDRFLVPAGTPLGVDPIIPVTTQISKLIYDSRDRTIAIERYTGAVVGNLVASQEPDVAPVGFSILTDGTLESVSETLYDEASRVCRTVSGRVQLASLSDVALAQDQALASYSIYSDGVDRYVGDALSTGIISDTLFDDRGRQNASLGHPLPASDLGLTGASYDGNLVRIRSETSYNRNGQTGRSRSGLAQVESLDGTVVGVFDEDSIDSKSYFDAFGNVYRSDLIADGTLQSYTLTRVDDENRPIAKMQATAGSVMAVWGDSLESFINSVTGDLIPTKLYRYDSDDRLVAVELPAIADPNNGGAITRPRYEYSYNERGSQTGILDPLGHETRFTFTDRGQQATRTLPLGFGDDGIVGTADDTSAGGFTESMTYDDLGRMRLHISFEGVVKENIYDGFGRMSAMNYYASEADFAVGLINQRDEYVFDTYGRRSGWTRYEATSPVALATGVTSAADDSNFFATRTEATIFDHRGRVLHEISPEGTLSYDYDVQGRMAYTAIDAVIPAVTGSIGFAADLSTGERVTSYSYDILGRLDSVSEDATPTDDTDPSQTHTDYSYEMLGRKRAQLTFAPGDPVPNGIETSYQYDSLGRLDMMTDTDGNGNTLAYYDYEVRSDGKRTSSIEETWFDENNDGVQDAGEVKTSTYDWTYDNAGRLSDEVLDHWDDGFDQTEIFNYDLTGNRMQLDRDKGNDGTIDEAITYTYDANDRLLDEVLDSIVDTDDTTTTYAYDQTQQTSKAVERTIDQLPVSAQQFTYNLQGRMASVVNEGFDSSGVLTSRERTGYEYDSRSFRVELANETDAALDGNFTLSSTTEFLASHRNKSGYAQTLRETKYDENGNLVKQIDYTFGDDEIAQRVRDFDAGGSVTSDETLVFGHDGHGSVRVLYDLAGTATKIIQAFTFSAYGQMLALHNAAAQNIAVSGRLSSTGYSGETFDSASQQQYLRARFYNSSNGRFNRLDPFVGNNNDPQSLHKYAYVHGDPISGVDPTGEFVVAVAIVLGVIALAYFSSPNPSVVHAPSPGDRSLSEVREIRTTTATIARANNLLQDDTPRKSIVLNDWWNNYLHPRIRQVSLRDTCRDQGCIAVGMTYAGKWERDLFSTDPNRYGGSTLVHYDLTDMSVATQMLDDANHLIGNYKDPVVLAYTFSGAFAPVTVPSSFNGQQLKHFDYNSMGLNERSFDTATLEPETGRWFAANGGRIKHPNRAVAVFQYSSLKQWADRHRDRGKTNVLLIVTERGPGLATYPQVRSLREML